MFSRFKKASRSSGRSVTPTTPWSPSASPKHPKKHPRAISPDRSNPAKKQQPSISDREAFPAKSATKKTEAAEGHDRRNTAADEAEAFPADGDLPESEDILDSILSKEEQAADPDSPSPHHRDTNPLLDLHDAAHDLPRIPLKKHTPSSEDSTPAAAGKARAPGNAASPAAKPAKRVVVTSPLPQHTVRQDSDRQRSPTRTMAKEPIYLASSSKIQADIRDLLPQGGAAATPGLDIAGLAAFADTIAKLKASVDSLQSMRSELTTLTEHNQLLQATLESLQQTKSDTPSAPAPQPPSAGTQARPRTAGAAPSTTVNSNDQAGFKHASTPSPTPPPAPTPASHAPLLAVTPTPAAAAMAPSLEISVRILVFSFFMVIVSACACVCGGGGGL